MASHSASSLPQHPRGFSSDLPVSGAWRPGMHPGRRRFHSFATPERPFALESGGALGQVTVAYETWGELDEDASNAVLICHALTGDSHVSGPLEVGHPTPGWWEEIVGPGLAIDTDRYFVVCANVLGGCQGSTGPSSAEPSTGTPYGSQFPTVTIRDMVRCQARLADALGVDRWLSVIGGSMGGMQVLEWGAMYPHRVRSLASLCSAMAASAQQIAWSAVGRLALTLDPRWRGGDYYGAERGDGPHAGLAIARQIAQIHYRSDEVFQDRFGRELVDSSAVFGLWDRFQVESYLDYHGEKLVRRFDANSYLLLNRAMDLHDLARGRRSLRAAAGRIQAPVLTLSISSDFLYPPHQQREVHDLIVDTGGTCRHLELDSPQGHDGFLLEVGPVGEAIAELLHDAETTGAQP
ncbi:MAG: homoserine O-acetyltransferase [Acidimicrobiales bacterium]|nr:homoserine O-acetyltransferase [Acidimicrobiales bacterium]